MGDREGRIEVEDVELFTYWCAEITREELERGDEDGITLFPILRIENYEDEEVSPFHFVQFFNFSSQMILL